MFTDEQRELFSKVLDKNWEVKELDEKGMYYEALAANAELDTMKAELKESMGAEAYNNFIEQGKKMFSPKTD